MTVHCLGGSARPYNQPMTKQLHFLQDGAIHIEHPQGDTNTIISSGTLRTAAVLSERRAGPNGETLVHVLAARTADASWVTFTGHWEATGNDPSAWWNKLPKELREKLAANPQTDLERDEIIAIGHNHGSVQQVAWEGQNAPFTLPKDLTVFVSAYTQTNP